MRSSRPRIIRDNTTFFESYDTLRPGDIVCCRLRLRANEEHLMVDLAERGIRVIPSLRAQLCSRSKAFQTRLFSWAMPPDTTVIYNLHDLLTAVGRYGAAGHERVVVKQEGKNGGLGVFLFKGIEDVYSQSALGLIPYPYVLQPFIGDSRDIRVIILGSEYVESYERANPHTFRNNLHCGGVSSPVRLGEEQLTLCRTVMEQGAFPYAHIDLMVGDDGRTFFVEINLRGGLRGAQIDSGTYHRLIEKIEDDLAEAASRLHAA